MTNAMERGDQLGFQRTAYVLFGGVGSGKTTLATALERRDRTVVVSHDRLFYERDMLAREGISFDPREERARRIAEATEATIVLDEMVTPSSLTAVTRANYSVTAVYIKVTEQVRFARFQERSRRQNQILRSLSDHVGLDLTSYSRHERRALWRSNEFMDNLRPSDQAEIHRLLKEMYWSGAHNFYDRKPDPLTYKGVHYVIELTDDDDLRSFCLSALASKRVPYRRYANERRGNRLKLCIWDVGNVLYEYSLSPVYDLLRRKSGEALTPSPPPTFGDYMCGREGFSPLCKRLCDLFDVRYTLSVELDIARAFRQGVGKTFHVCQETIQRLRARGVRNVILSNAFPVLASEGNLQNIFQPEDTFLSFNTGLLKPEAESFLNILAQTKVQPEDALCVDDKAANILAAIELGISGIVFEPETFVKELRRQLGTTLQW
jgi:HAD superfamily hydrolase (TIGR01509 family)